MKPNLTWLAVAILALSGCKNLDTVEALSGTLVAASKSLDSVAEDLEGSCIRTRQFNPKIDCASSARASKGLVAADKLLVAYFRAIGDVADAHNFTVKPGLGDLVTSVEGIPGIDTAKVDAASGLAGLIAKAFTENARQRALHRLIEEGVPRAKSLVALLAERVPHALDTDLNAEQDNVDSQFVAYATESFGTPPNAMCEGGPKSFAFKSGPNFLVALEYCKRTNGIADKRAAIKNYQQALENIDDSLDALNSSKSDLSTIQLLGKVRDSVDQLKTNVEAVKKAFGEGNPK